VIINGVCVLVHASRRWPATANWPLIFTKLFSVAVSKKKEEAFSAACL
jgi:hypothetical protein